MQKKGWILVFVCAVAVLVFGSLAYGKEPSVTITDAYTTNYMGELTDQFKVWEPVFLHIEYTITGAPKTIYRSVGKIAGLGRVITMKDRVRVHEDDLRFDETRVITAKFANNFGCTPQTITYTVNLFLGLVLKASDTVDSTITVVPPEGCPL
jgi:hypothetical protein